VYTQRHKKDLHYIIRRGCAFFVCVMLKLSLCRLHELVEVFGGFCPTDKIQKIFLKMFVVLIAALSVVALAAPSNMNGKYIVTSGNKVGVQFNDDYASKGHEYFDVYSRTF